MPTVIVLKSGVPFAPNPTTVDEVLRGNRFFYVGGTYGGFIASALSSPFRPNEVGGEAAALRRYQEWLDEVVHVARSPAYDMLALLGIAARQGDAALATFYPGRCNAHVIIEKLRTLHDLTPAMPVKMRGVPEALGVFA